MPIPILLLIGTLIIVSFYFGRSMKWIKLPSIIGFMIVGVISGPSFLNLVTDDIQEHLGFITEIALGFVAFSIGLELSLSILKKQGVGIISIIFAESFCAFFVVLASVFFLTKDLPLSIIFASIAPASAPAGTVAIIKEYKAKGNLTKALYAVVGFDDGLAIIIFGFAAAIARMLLTKGTSGESIHLISSMIKPLQEIGISILVGFVLSLVLINLVKRIKKSHDILILICGFIFIINGLCVYWHLSLILTNMIVGLVIVNTQKREIVHKIGEQLSNIMPLFFVLFFALAGAHLHIKDLPAMGWIGIIYIISRSIGLIGGARLGGMFGNVEDKVKKYTGLGILSQAGVAIGLSLIILHEFKGLGSIIKYIDGKPWTTGDQLGATIITTVTATCIFFEIIGPILTKIALEKAGEIESGNP